MTIALGTQWILASAVAWTLGFVTGCEFAGPVGGGLVFGVGVALAPWMILRDRIRWSRAQPMASILLGGAIGAVGFGAYVHPALIGLAIGAVLAIMQWFELRRQFARAGWWLLATPAGMSGGMVVGYAISCTASPLAGFVGGVVAAAVTGLTLAWLLRSASA